MANAELSLASNYYRPNPDLHTRDSNIALFYGKEREGPLAGSPTLFMKGDVPLFAVESWIVRLRAGDLPLTNIYVGAGRQTAFSAPWLIRVLGKTIGLRVTCELGNANEGYEKWLLPILPRDSLLFLTNFSKRVSWKGSGLDVWYKTEEGDNLVFESATGRKPVLKNTFDGYPEDVVLYTLPLR